MLFGPPAVGKMTVGYELQRLTGVRLFHNHMAIELALNFFEFGTLEFRHIVQSIRHEVFATVAKSNLPGLTFTFVWNFDNPVATKLTEAVVEIFEAVGAEIYYVELFSELEERLRRNSTALRLEQKPSKRDIDASTQRLLANEDKRLNTGW